MFFRDEVAGLALCSTPASLEDLGFSVGVLYSIHRSDFIAEAESVYSAVQTGSLYKLDTFRL